MIDLIMYQTLGAREILQHHTHVFNLRFSFVCWFQVIQLLKLAFFAWLVKPLLFFNNNKNKALCTLSSWISYPLKQLTESLKQLMEFAIVEDIQNQAYLQFYENHGSTSCGQIMLTNIMTTYASVNSTIREFFISYIK